MDAFLDIMSGFGWGVVVGAVASPFLIVCAKWCLNKTKAALTAKK